MSRRVSGLRAWLLQRLSAVYMAIFLLYFFIVLAMGSVNHYAAWRDWLLQPVMSVAVMIFFAALLLHAWVGMRDILIDYIKPVMIRLSLMSLVVIMLVAMGFWVLRIMLVAA